MVGTLRFGVPCQPQRTTHNWSTRIVSNLTSKFFIYMLHTIPLMNLCPRWWRDMKPAGDDVTGITSPDMTSPEGRHIGLLTLQEPDLRSSVEWKWPNTRSHTIPGTLGWAVRPLYYSYVRNKYNFHQKHQVLFYSKHTVIQYSNHPQRQAEREEDRGECDNL